MERAASPVQSRLLWGFFAALFAGLLIAGASLYALRLVVISKDNVTFDHAADLIAAERVRSSIVRVATAERGFLFTGSEEFLKQYEDARAELDREMNVLERKVESAEGRTLFAELRERIATHTSAAERVITMRRRGVDLPVVSDEFERSVLPAGDRMRRVVDALIALKDRKLAAAHDASVWAANRATYLILFLTAAALTLAGTLALVLTRTVARLYDELATTNEELERFAYLVSHDLREPLRTVSGFVGLLERRYGEKLDAGARDLIAHASDGARRMAKLIESLLEFSRVGHAPLALAEVDTGACVRGVWEDLGLAVRESGATLSVGDLPRVQADASQLGRVFQNLLSNAIKFGGEASPRVEVTASRDGARWRFCVADSGPGIPADERERIFEFFQRGQGGARRQGSGIGLAACRRIVERHGGKIWVESEPGHGARFYFTLPITRHTREAAQSPRGTFLHNLRRAATPRSRHPS